MIQSVHDVAAAVLGAEGRRVRSERLHILLYYVQGWSLAWDGEVLFGARIVPSSIGPLVPHVAVLHGKSEMLGSWPGDPKKLSILQRETARAVVNHLKPRTLTRLRMGVRKHRTWDWAWRNDSEVIGVPEIERYFVRFKGSRFEPRRVEPA